MQPKIRFIIAVFTSKQDVNGNRYHAGSITSTVTGRTLYIGDVGGAQNLTIAVREVTDSLVYVDYSTVTKRELAAMRKQWERMHGDDYQSFEPATATLAAQIRNLESI